MIFLILRLNKKYSDEKIKRSCGKQDYVKEDM